MAASEEAIQSMDTDDFLSMDSIFSLASSMAVEEEEKKRGLFRDIMTTENDMAGINGLWLIGFIILVIFRVTGYDDVKDAKWGFIVCIPVVICCFTWIFSYVITKYRKATIVESLKAPPFVIPFLLKITVAMVVFGRLFYAQGGIRDRYKSDLDYNGYCNCTIVVVYFVLFLSTVITEIMITTVMVNSSENLLPKIPKKVDAFLFLTRPSIWVYNRLLVMFVTFYCFYFLFGIGPFCASLCPVDDVKQVRHIGTAIFTLPFKDVLYLFKWYSFDLEKHTTAKDVQFAVIQQFLIWTTILDFAMDIWSISLVFSRNGVAQRIGSSFKRLKSTSAPLRTSQVLQGQKQLQSDSPGLPESNSIEMLKGATHIEQVNLHKPPGRATQIVATEVAAMLNAQQQSQLHAQPSVETDDLDGSDGSGEPVKKPQLEAVSDLVSTHL